MARDILDQIDGALQDWTVSGDAMRWVPEEDRTEPPPAPRLAGWTDVGYVRDDDLGEAYQRRPATVAEFNNRLVEIMRPAVEHLNQAFDNLVRALPQLRVRTQDGYVLWPPPQQPEETPRERALRLRQTHNTGPAKPLPSYRAPVQRVRRHTRRKRTRGRRRG